MSMTRLVRKCTKAVEGGKCNTLMVVDVGEPKKANVYDNKGRLIEEVEVFGSYDDVVCVEGCFLGFTLCGYTFHLPVLNRTVKRAVYCSNCHAVRHLKLFKELKT